MATFKLGAFVALLVAMTVSAVAQPLEPPIDRDLAHDHFRDIAPPSIACPDQQTIDEMIAMRRMGDREGEAITRRSYGCGPVLPLDGFTADERDRDRDRYRSHRRPEAK